MVADQWVMVRAGLSKHLNILGKLSTLFWPDVHWMISSSQYVNLEYEEIGKRGEEGGKPGEEGQKVRAGWGQWAHHCLVPFNILNFKF